MREAEIEKIFKKEVERLGGLCWKWISPGNAGVPDRVVILPGFQTFFVEFKREGRGLDPLQVQQHKRMANAGSKPLVIAGMRDVLRFFEMLGFDETVDRLVKAYEV